MELSKHGNRGKMTSGKRLLWCLPPLALLCLFALAWWLQYATMLNGNGVSRAKLDVKSLESAINAFHFKYDRLPTSLDELTQLGPDESPAYFTDKNVLIDPWRSPYNYDPENLHPISGKPFIWSNGPPNKPRRITNWD